MGGVNEYLIARINAGALEKHTVVLKIHKAMP
jgi:hypothetical protein